MNSIYQIAKAAESAQYMRKREAYEREVIRTAYRYVNAAERLASQVVANGRLKDSDERRSNIFMMAFTASRDEMIGEISRLNCPKSPTASATRTASKTSASKTSTVKEKATMSAYVSGGYFTPVRRVY